MCFNPSYGLHALRAILSRVMANIFSKFQSLIWVACPTGGRSVACGGRRKPVSIPHMGCMPYGPYTVLLSGLCSSEFQSLIWVACPTGRQYRLRQDLDCSFNPSYGLHALRARRLQSASPIERRFQSLIWVACPTGLAAAAAVLGLRCRFNPSYGLHALRALVVCMMARIFHMFQSLIWVACPTGF